MTEAKKRGRPARVRVKQLPARDGDVIKAVQEFFIDGAGDMHELEYVIQLAVESISAQSLELPTPARKALRDNRLDTVRQLMDMTFWELATKPGIGTTIAGQIIEALAVFRRTYHVRPAETNNEETTV